MITDEKIKEELEKLTSQFNDTYYINLVTRSFNAGLRAAERLAKIEKLEEK